MEFKQIQELIKAVNKSTLSELKIEDGDFKITIRQSLGNDAPQYMQMPMAPQQMMMPMQQQAPQQSTSPAAHASSGASEAPTAQSKLEEGVPVKSPMIGTFYRSSSPDKPPFVSVGDEIAVGQVICIIEAMKLFNEIESEVSGRVVKVVADDASPVEYDQPLFIIEPL